MKNILKNHLMIASILFAVNRPLNGVDREIQL